MLLVHNWGQSCQEYSPELQKSVPWFDIFNPTQEEEDIAEQISGFRIPTRMDMEEIESSSRLYMEDDRVYMTTPLIRFLGESFVVSPVGFVLNGLQLITIRFSNFSSFEETSRVVAQSKKPLTAEGCMTILVESIVDRLADILENLGRTIDSISHDIFQASSHNQTGKGNELKKMLKRIGRCGDMASAVRDSLAGLERICNFITEDGKRPLAPALQGKWGIISRDITSLIDFVSQKNAKVQFLLDAILGFVSIEQNSSVNILTAVSLSGIIPTLIAGIYGMNFKYMPELQWDYGYYYSLVLIIVSIVVPLWWFWYKGWFGNKL